jgi:hypothetical protein
LRIAVVGEWPTQVKEVRVGRGESGEGVGERWRQREGAMSDGVRGRLTSERGKQPLSVALTEIDGEMEGQCLIFFWERAERTWLSEGECERGKNTGERG